MDRNLLSQAYRVYQQISPMSRIIFQAVKEPARLPPITTIWYPFFRLRADESSFGVGESFSLKHSLSRNKGKYIKFIVLRKSKEKYFNVSKGCLYETIRAV